MKIWENKNAKRALRGAGLTTMALSLAACGSDSEDLTPFDQDDIDAATTPIQADLDAATASLAAAVAAQATAEAAQAAAEAAAEAAATAQAAAEAAQADAEGDAAAAATAQAAAEAATATAQAAQATAEAAQAAAEASLADMVAELAAAGFTDLTDLISAYDALLNPAGGSFELVASTTDTLVGTSGDDTFTGTAATYADADQVIDASTTDADVYNLTISAAATPQVTNVETVNIAFNSLATGIINLGSVTGASVVNVSRGDVTIGGATLTGNKVVTLTEVSSSAIGEIVIGAGATDVSVNQNFVAGGGVAGIVLNATGATGDITVTGAASITANGAGTGDSVTVNVLGTASTATSTAVENAKAVSVETSAVGATGAGNGVTVGAFTGTIDVTANSVLDVDINNAAGSVGAVTVAANASVQTAVQNAAGGATVTSGVTSTADSTITIAGIDNSGATVVTGTGVSAASGKNITVTLTGGTGTTDVASVSGNGYISLSNTNIENLNLSGSSAAVTYNVTAGTATTYAATGDYAVSLRGDAARFDESTVTGVTTLTLSAGTGDADLSDVSATSINIAYDTVDNGPATVTVAGGAAVELTSDQASLTFALATGATTSDLSLTAGDEDTSSATVGTVTVGALATGAGATTAGTLTLDATESNFTATGVTLGGRQHMTIVGDEDVSLGIVAGGASTQVNGSASTGNITLTTTTLAPIVSTGSGDDNVTVFGADIHTISTNAGDDTITITSTDATSTIDAGEGDDSITLTDEDAYVVIGGAGDDTFTFSNTATDEFDAVIIGGDGTDTLVTAAATTLRTVAANQNDTANANFAISGVERINFTAGDLALSASQITGQTIALIADGDALTVDVDTATGNLDASGITIRANSTATLTYTGGTGANVITGGAAAETIVQTRGADTIDGGAGADTFALTTGLQDTGSAASTGTVVNMGSAAIAEASIVAAVGTYLGGAETEVASGTYAMLYAANLGANSGVTGSIANVENITGTTDKDYIVGSSSNNVISSGTGADYIDGGAGDDTITGGAGADTLTGGSGADTFVMVAADAGDTITDFTTAVDDFDFNTTLVAIGGANAVSFQSAAAGTAIGAATTVFELTGVTTGGTAANLVTALGQTATDATIDAADSILFVNYLTAGGAQIWHFVDASGDNVDAGELTLLATLSDVAADALVAGDFI